VTDRENIILLSIDALRADHVAYHGYERETTPFLNTLRNKGVSFTNAISPSSHTREAMPSLLTGRHPHIFADKGYTLVGNTTAGHLSDYATAGFHSNPYLSRAYGFGDEFGAFDDDFVLGSNRLVALAQRALNKFVLNKGEYHARAQEINEKSLDWLDRLDGEQFFLWNHYMDVHGPYNPPAGYDEYSSNDLSNEQAQALYQKCIKNPEAITDTESELLVDLYDGEIRYLDDQLEQFFTALEARGLQENSIIIIVADHGDAFGEYGYFTHPRELHDVLLHVPMIILHPALDGRTIDSVVSTLDVVPTLLDWVEQPAPEMDGQSLLVDGGISTGDRSGAVLSSAQGIDSDEGTRLFALRDKDWKVLLRRQIDSNEVIEESLFSVTAEEQEVAWETTDDPRVEELKEQLDSISEQHTGSMSGAPDATEEVDEEIEDRLEALGYK